LFVKVGEAGGGRGKLGQNNDFRSSSKQFLTYSTATKDYSTSMCSTSADYFIKTI